MRILVCPLDWGLGHASRMIPLIQALARAHEVILAASGGALELLRAEFPDLPYICFPGIKITYSRRRLALSILAQIPRIIAGIREEHLALKLIADKHHIDAVVSDNRFGLWNKQLRTIYISHQIMVKLPRPIRLLEPILCLIHKRIIAQYDHCLIPDYKGHHTLAGDLTHKYPPPANAHFIGPLSRFQPAEQTSKCAGQHILGIVSGPEPQRSLFEQLLLSEFKKTSHPCTLIRGLPGQNTPISDTAPQIKVYNHLSSDDLQQEILNAEHIICRAGYSSIMDFVNLQKHAILVPTPGQTEQEYLGAWLMQKKHFISMPQGDFELKTALKKNKETSLNAFPKPSIMPYEFIEKLITGPKNKAIRKEKKKIPKS